MNRRTLLAAVATAGATIAGCLDDASNDDSSPGGNAEDTDDSSNGDESTREYVECTAPFVDYDELPDELAAEVDAAFDDGAYETDGRPLYDRAVSQGTPLWTDGAPHDHEVEQDGDDWQLSFDRRTSYESKRTLSLINEVTESVSVTVTIIDEDGNPVVNAKSYEVGPDDREHVPAVAAFGEYEVTVEVDGERENSYTWEVAAPRVEIVEGLEIWIDEDDVSIDPLISVYDYVPCPMQWESR